MNKTNKPKNVKISWMKYPIKWLNEVLLDKGPEIARCFGAIDYRKEIQIQKDQNPDALKQSLIHEMVHGWIHHYIDKNGVGEHEEENVVKFTQALHESIQQNPKLWKWLIGE